MFGDKYYNPKTAGSYSGVNVFLKNNSVDKKRFKKWSQSQDVITIHRPRRIKFPRLQTVVIGASIQIQMDLMDMQKYESANNGVKYILIAIDVFSRYAYAEPLFNKSADQVFSGLEKIFKKKCPKRAQSDCGGWFFNKKVGQLFKKNKITHFASYNYDIKCSIAERFIKTLKSRILKYLYHQNTEKYIDVLQELVSVYNGSYHRSLRMSPKEAEKSENWVQVWINQFIDLPSKRRKNKFRVGDLVRISRYKGIFEKGFSASWSEEHFEISKIRNGDPAVYKLQDLMGDPIEGIFYEQELQLITPPEKFKIERVIRQNKGWFLVKYKGWPDKFNSWVKRRDLKRHGGLLRGAPK